MSDYAAELFPYVYTCPRCEAEQRVTRREAIDYGGHLARAGEAAEFALHHKHGWTVEQRAVVCPSCDGDLDTG